MRTSAKCNWYFALLESSRRRRDTRDMSCGGTCGRNESDFTRVEIVAYHFIMCRFIFINVPIFIFVYSCDVNISFLGDFCGGCLFSSTLIFQGQRDTGICHPKGDVGRDHPFVVCHEVCSIPSKPTGVYKQTNKQTNKPRGGDPGGHSDLLPVPVENCTTQGTGTGCCVYFFTWYCM